MCTLTRVWISFVGMGHRTASTYWTASPRALRRSQGEKAGRNTNMSTVQQLSTNQCGVATPASDDVGRKVPIYHPSPETSRDCRIGEGCFEIHFCRKLCVAWAEEDIGKNQRLDGAKFNELGGIHTTGLQCTQPTVHHGEPLSRADDASSYP
jgi:hypothetical protein